MYTFSNLIDIIAKLRSEDGCPWDREQTFESMKKYLGNETLEIYEAVDKGDMENLCEELGDVLFQLVMYAQMASEIGAFTMDDVVDGAAQKMVRRHPHVFGDVKVTTAEEGLALWNAIKAQEKAADKADKKL